MPKKPKKRHPLDEVARIVRETVRRAGAGDGTNCSKWGHAMLHVKKLMDGEN
jgi:hypothetical protein